MDWYLNWFNQDYLRLYAHRDRLGAEREAEWVLGQLPCKGGSVLDIGCGSGRHLGTLKGGFERAFGFDLSLELLRSADPVLLAGPRPAALVCGDMRALPFAAGAFQLVTSFFTSFGYFPEDSAHQALLAEWRRVLTESGTLFLDYLNKGYVQAHLETTSEKQCADFAVTEQRYFTPDGLRLVKDIEISDARGKRYYKESVRVYDRSEVESMLRRAGFEISAVFGDFTGEAHSDTSKRLIFFARAA